MSLLRRICLLVGLLGFSFSFLSGCISINLPGLKSTKATDISFSEPKAPFKSLNASNTDRSWVSLKTSNTIAYSSDCSDNSPSIGQMMSESLSALGKIDTVSENKVIFNERDALSSVAVGNIDGIAVKMAILTFKRNKCSYLLTYGGVEKNFDAELKHFEEFQNSFKAP